MGGTWNVIDVYPAIRLSLSKTGLVASRDPIPACGYRKASPQGMGLLGTPHTLYLEIQLGANWALLSTDGGVTTMCSGCGFCSGLTFM
jgi:hypothetical protein